MPGLVRSARRSVFVLWHSIHREFHTVAQTYKRGGAEFRTCLAASHLLFISSNHAVVK